MGYIPYIILLSIVLWASPARADVIYLNDNTEERGIVVEEYADRVIISTYNGEKSIFRKDIRKLVYDLPEQNLVKMGDKYLSRREYERAYFYYEKASKINPEYEPARDKMNYVMGFLFRQRERSKLQDVKRRKEFGNQAPALSSPKKESLYESAGLRVAGENGDIKITSVRSGSSAFKAGLRPGDTLVSVWGRFTKYMSEKDIERVLLEESFGEIKLCISREITLKKDKARGKSYRDIIGGKMNLLPRGLTLTDLKENGPAEKAGLMKNDLIVSLNGEETRYMPFGEAVKIIENPGNSTIRFAVRRDVTIWKK